MSVSKHIPFIFMLLLLHCFVHVPLVCLLFACVCFAGPFARASLKMVFGLSGKHVN
jgi:hypothetical protein